MQEPIVQSKQLFPASIDTEEIPFASLDSKSAEAKQLTMPLSDSVTIEELRSELRILKLQNSDLTRKLHLANDRSAVEAEAREVLLETQTQLFLLQDQMQELRSQRDFERLERNTLQASFEAERAAFEETLSRHKKELESVKELQQERKWLQEALDRLQKEKEALQVQVVDATAKESRLKELESNQTRLLSALKKGQQVREQSKSGPATINHCSLC